TDQAEAFVERQARAFELGKPYLVERWRALEAASRDGKAGKGGKEAGKSRKSRAGSKVAAPGGKRRSESGAKR
ncbi:MAG: hypothetical protein H0X20_04560, partial [Chloroflexi bacterium]|nr:hypothetical protein [Chloroflexota bacterium]